MHRGRPDSTPCRASRSPRPRCRRRRRLSKPPERSPSAPYGCNAMHRRQEPSSLHRWSPSVRGGRRRISTSVRDSRGGRVQARPFHQERRWPHRTGPRRSTEVLCRVARAEPSCPSHEPQRGQSAPSLLHTQPATESGTQGTSAAQDQHHSSHNGPTPSRSA